MGRPSREQAKSLDDQILAVAGVLFIERGYGATSMATVASTARVGKQTLYRRFPDKASLFRDVIGRRIDAFWRTAAECREVERPWTDLKRVGRIAIDLILDPEFIRLYRIVIAEAQMFPELACTMTDELSAKLGGRCINAIRRAQDEGLCRSASPEALSQWFLWSLVGEALFKGLSARSGYACSGDRDLHVDRVCDLFLNGVSSYARYLPAPDEVTAPS
jgi:TetR/AcrR family transcriptional repressor of mexJK operon